MVLLKSAMTALASVALAASPVVAQAAPAKGSVMAKVSTVRAGADVDAKDKSHVKGGGAIVAVVAVIAIIGGILAATTGSSKPKSP